MSWAIWITGLPGSGKSATARSAAVELAATGEPVTILELDALRRALTPVPTHDAVEADAVYRALVLVARTLTRAGEPVLIDATGPRRAWRDLARVCLGDFAEVQLVCPLDVAHERERTRPTHQHARTIHAQPRHPASLRALEAPYEPPPAAELAIDTTDDGIGTAGARVAALARTFQRRPLPRAGGGAGWALWIGGRAGSGKTTVASGVCERMAAQGTDVIVLDAAEFAEFLVPGGPLSDVQREVATRAVVAAARLLHDAGAAVVIDACARLGDGGPIAREVIDRFAQVELACAPGVCRLRDHVARGRRLACATAALALVGPDPGLDYEAPARPDLVLETDLMDSRTTAEEVVRLVDRLERTARKRRRPCA